jgi:hypothetical protein
MKMEEDGSQRIQNPGDPVQDAGDPGWFQESYGAALHYLSAPRPTTSLSGIWAPRKAQDHDTAFLKERLGANRDRSL